MSREGLTTNELIRALNAQEGNASNLVNGVPEGCEQIRANCERRALERQKSRERRERKGREELERLEYKRQELERQERLEYERRWVPQQRLACQDDTFFGDPPSMAFGHGSRDPPKTDYSGDESPHLPRPPRRKMPNTIIFNSGDVDRNNFFLTVASKLEAGPTRTLTFTPSTARSTNVSNMYELINAIFDYGDGRLTIIAKNEDCDPVVRKVMELLEYPELEYLRISIILIGGAMRYFLTKTRFSRRFTSVILTGSGPRNNRTLAEIYSGSNLMVYWNKRDDPRSYGCSDLSELFIASRCPDRDLAYSLLSTLLSDDKSARLLR